VTPVYSQNDDQGNGSGVPASRTTPLIIAQPGIGISVNFYNKFRFSQDDRMYFNTADGSLEYEEVSLSAIYYIGKIDRFNFTTTISYLHTLNNNFQTSQYRPKYYFTVIYHKNKIKLGLRNRFEYIIKTGGNSNRSFRYRPRLKFGVLIKYNKIRLYPYIYNEFFIGENGFNQDRVKLALSARYKNFQFNVGNLFKFKTTSGFVEDRISFEIRYRIKIKNNQTDEPEDEIGVDPIYR
jgi:hypothetical protein